VEQGVQWAQYRIGWFRDKNPLFFLTGVKHRLFHKAGKSVHQLGYAGSQIDTMYLKGYSPLAQSLNTKFEKGNRYNVSAAPPNQKLLLMGTKGAKMLPQEFFLLKPTSKLRRISIWEALS
jgi:hypothetical protein